ncbi:MAG: hypothetical protein LBN92_03595 [Treponema sp.]|nr:hypothetical protein [Treponema sp.]
MVKKMFCILFGIFRIASLYAEEPDIHSTTTSVINYFYQCISGNKMGEALDTYYYNSDQFEIDFDEYYWSLIPFRRINATLLPQSDVLNRYTLISSSVFEIKWLIAGLLAPQKYHDMVFGGRVRIDAKTYEKEVLEITAGPITPVFPA